MNSNDPAIMRSMSLFSTKFAMENVMDSDDEDWSNVVKIPGSEN